MFSLIIHAGSEGSDHCNNKITYDNPLTRVIYFSAMSLHVHVPSYPA